jgi:hypothetical protein
VSGGSDGGNGGGVSFEETCPAGAIFAGFRGTSFENSFVDQLGIMCRWPWQGEQAYLSLQGSQLTDGSRVADTFCPTPWKPTAIEGRSGLLIDKMGMGCFSPESTSAVAIGGMADSV